MAIRISTNLMSTLLRFYKNMASELRGTTIMIIIVSIKNSLYFVSEEYDSDITNISGHI